MQYSMSDLPSRGLAKEEQRAVFVGMYRLLEPRALFVWFFLSLLLFTSPHVVLLTFLKF